MIRQYKAPRRRGGYNPLGVGVIAVGSIYYLRIVLHCRPCQNLSATTDFKAGMAALSPRVARQIQASRME